MLALAIEIVCFGFALWLGLYLVMRDRTKPILWSAGLGLMVYAVSLGLDVLGQVAPTPLQSSLITFTKITTYLPILFWLATLYFARQNQPNLTFRNLFIIATLFFTLGITLIIFPLDWLPRFWVILGIELDLTLLGLVVATLDAFNEGESLQRDLLRSFVMASLTALIFAGQIGVVMSASTGVTFGMMGLLLTVIATAIVLQAFASRWQSWLDGLLLARWPQLRQEQAELQAAAEAITRVNPSLELIEMPEKDFIRLTRRALSHLSNLPRLASSPLIQLPMVAGEGRLQRAAQLKVLLIEQIGQLKPVTDEKFASTDAWRHYNALYFPYVVGLKPYSRRAIYDNLPPEQEQALDWFRTMVPERTLYNWQNAGAKLIAGELRTNLQNHIASPE